MKTSKEEENTSKPKDNCFLYSVCLDEDHLSFIDKCKKRGLLGCSITVNNTQTYVSFINEHNDI